MESFAFWYWFIAGCICLGPLVKNKEVKAVDKWLAFFGGFILLPMMFGIFWDEMWTAKGRESKKEKVQYVRKKQ